MANIDQKCYDNLYNSVVKVLITTRGNLSHSVDVPFVRTTKTSEEESFGFDNIPPLANYADTLLKGILAQINRNYSFTANFSILASHNATWLNQHFNEPELDPTKAFDANWEPLWDSVNVNQRQQSRIETTATTSSSSSSAVASSIPSDKDEKPEQITSRSHSKRSSLSLDSADAAALTTSSAISEGENRGAKKSRLPEADSQSNASSSKVSRRLTYPEGADAYSNMREEQIKRDKLTKLDKQKSAIDPALDPDSAPKSPKRR